ncbi:MAG: transcription elongation factor GreA [Hyphomicrobiales bacterium]|nr:transcription elongation factor GreA [Hyphomicrobiales bacterium]
MEKFPITQEGFNRMEEEVKRLKTEDRPAIITAIADAREHGDLKENAEYHAAKERQSFVEGRIQELEHKIAHAEVIDISELSGKRVKFGAKVKLVDVNTDKEATYQIVGEYEADLEQGKISLMSPIARALIGKEEGDDVEIQTPGGEKVYEILNVSYR